MYKIKKTLHTGIFFIYLLLPLNVLCSDNNYGLYFKSKEVVKEYRTGLDLTFAEPIKYSGTVHLTFDISFRHQMHFGYIFRFKELNDDNQFDFICHFDEPDPDLYLIHNHRETGLDFQISPELKKYSNRWYRVELKLNADSGYVKMIFNDESSVANIKIPNNSRFILCFGVVSNYGFQTQEVPPMAIQNLRVVTDQTKEYYWPLNQTDGNVVKDVIHKKKALITNPEWNVNYHMKWENIETLILPALPQFAFNNKDNKFYFVYRDNYLFSYNVQNATLDSIETKLGKPVYEDANQVIISDNSEIISYSHSINDISVFDTTYNNWSFKGDNVAYLPKHWHHNKLIHPVNKNITTICGYGFYTYTNAIQYFNNEQKKWVQLKFTGDTIYPRYLTSCGVDPKDRNKYYIFGGLGNPSGKQILGTEFYYDLYTVNFKNSTIEKLWENTQVPRQNFTPINSLVVDTINNCFYTLYFPHTDQNTYLRILKASLDEPEYSFIGDSLPYTFIDTDSYADLFYWEAANKLLCITSQKYNKQQSIIHIYSLNFPPIEAGFNIKKGILSYPLVIAVGTFVLLLVVIIYYKRKQKKAKLPVPDKTEKTDSNAVEKKEVELQEKSCINLFGGFQVIDKKGKDITYRFSKTLKELFLLLFLNSFDENKGISSQKIQENLWPFKPEAKAKNNRGVNINKLRALLADVGNIEIEYINPYWRIHLGNKVFCDYTYVKKMLAFDDEGDQTSTLQVFLKLAKKGKFLLNIQKDWLDSYKDEISSNIINYLEDKIKKLQLKDSMTFMLEIANTIFIFDEINETALHYKCKILSQQGKHSLALEAYEHYSKLYLKLYNEEYNIPYKQLIK